ncbi:hypothetical protein Taro_013605 [Colocasia esculenta]|uniref:Uncharacterized protein n=1 Tax=Colocasia esculenta TaxID=4460 RepID=A0A843UCH9_COLES|nr:hypothetical protein [Colocasia esculenta]
MSRDVTRGVRLLYEAWDVESVTVCTHVELPCFCFCLSPGHRATLCLDDRCVVVLRRAMAPRRRPREGVAEQATRQEAGDAPPPQQMQPLPQDAHSGIVPPPPPPPQVAQGLDLTRFLEGMAQFVAQHHDAPFLGQPDPDAARAWLDAVERTFRSMECVPEERVLLASYQLQAQALTWWSSEWETTF